MQRMKKKKQGGQPGPHKWIDLEAFAKAWRKASSRSEVAKQFRISPKGASYRASYLRRKGVKLSKLNHRMGNPWKRKSK